MLVIGIAGQIGSGKTTMAELFESRFGANTLRLSLSDVLKDILVGNLKPYYTRIEIEWDNKEFERENLIRFGKLVKMKYCDGVLMRLAVERGVKGGASFLIVDGVRTFGEVSELYNAEEYIRFVTGKSKRVIPLLIYVDAIPEVRFERVLKRGSSKDRKIKTLEDLKKFDEEEAKLYKVPLLKRVADYVVANNYKVVWPLRKRVEEIVNEIRERN